MSKRLQVLEAVKALVQTALPGAAVKGMTGDEAKPDTVGPLGMVIVRSGDPGQPQIDLSPPTYNYDHDIPMEVAAYKSSTLTSQQVLDAMMMRIGEAVEADRTLGGLVDWLDVDAPTDGEIDARGATPVGWADFTITATYSTTNPLT
jgi:hypothetical protein